MNQKVFLLDRQLLNKFVAYSKYPFEYMNVGDSFVVFLGVARTARTMKNRIQSALRRKGLNNKIKIDFEECPEGMRCRRVA